MTVEFEIGATIPVGSYANIQPRFTVTGADLSEARDKALAEMRAIYDLVNPDVGVKFGEQTHISSAPKGNKLTCFASGTEVWFEPVTHTYSPGRWLSGSAFANKFKAPFPSDTVSARMAAKYDVDAADIQAMWSLKGEASSSLGTAIHAALQQYGEFLELSRKIKGNADSALHDNPMLRDPVLKFFEGREDEKALYEAFCADPGVKGCGLIDRVLITGEKSARIQDFKTNTDIRKPVTVLNPFKGVIEATTLGIYWLQLSYYSHLISRHGWTVEGLDIFHWTGENWDTYTHDVVDVSAGFK